MLALALSLLAAAFQPAVLTRYEIDAIPYGVRAAGIVMLEVAVDAQGAAGDARVLKDIPPFTGLIQNRLAADWGFQPAVENGNPAATRVLVVGIYRPAMLEFPAPDKPSLPAADPQSAVPMPTSVAIAPYPARAEGDAGVMVEVQVDAVGAVVDARVMKGSPGFNDAAVGAARQWKFSPASRNGAGVPSRAYLFFAFRQPF